MRLFAADLNKDDNGTVLLLFDYAAGQLIDVRVSSFKLRWRCSDRGLLGIRGDMECWREFLEVNDGSSHGCYRVSDSFSYAGVRVGSLNNVPSQVRTTK
jgi:hypothetical protein